MQFFSYFTYLGFVLATGLVIKPIVQAETPLAIDPATIYLDATRTSFEPEVTEDTTSLSTFKAEQEPSKSNMPEQMYFNSNLLPSWLFTAHTDSSKINWSGVTSRVYLEPIGNNGLNAVVPVWDSKSAGHEFKLNSYTELQNYSQSAILNYHLVYGSNLGIDLGTNLGQHFLSQFSNGLPYLPSGEPQKNNDVQFQFNVNFRL